MRLYLDNCAFNRPFDDQSSIRIRLETEAKLYIQGQIKDGHLELVWSYILDFENAQNPFSDRRTAIKKWKDALHIASAVAANADYFLTTDDKLLNKTDLIKDVKLMNPTEFVKVLDNYDN
ncbi:MAG: PIN domain protein [Anaerolineae bacterium]|nr:PIN domain protein [Anaerolineae bacterium]